MFGKKKLIIPQENDISARLKLQKHVFTLQVNKFFVINQKKSNCRTQISQQKYTRIYTYQRFLTVLDHLGCFLVTFSTFRVVTAQEPPEIAYYMFQIP